MKYSNPDNSPQGKPNLYNSLKFPGVLCSFAGDAMLAQTPQSAPAIVAFTHAFICDLCLCLQ
jgi:hypothetical protein